jgi:hypothetical protein
MQLAPAGNSRAHAVSAYRQEAGAQKAGVQMAGCNGQVQMTGCKGRVRVACEWPGENGWVQIAGCVQTAGGANGSTVEAGNWPRFARCGLQRACGLWKAHRRMDPASTPLSSGCVPHGGFPVPRTMKAPGVRAHSQLPWLRSETDHEEGSKERESGADDGEVEEDEKL